MTNTDRSFAVLTYRSYLQARTMEELQDLAGCYHLRAMRTFGLIGGLPRREWGGCRVGAVELQQEPGPDDRVLLDLERDRDRVEIGLLAIARSSRYADPQAARHPNLSEVRVANSLSFSVEVRQDQAQKIELEPPAE